MVREGCVTEEGWVRRSAKEVAVVFGVFAQGYHGGEGGMVQVEVVCQMMDKYGYGKESPCQCSGAIWLALVWSVVFRNRFPDNRASAALDGSCQRVVKIHQSTDATANPKMREHLFKECDFLGQLKYQTINNLAASSGVLMGTAILPYASLTPQAVGN